MPALPRVTGVTSLSNGFLSEVVQICIVTGDYERTMAGMVQAGIGPWRVYTFDQHTVADMSYRGKPASYAMRVCLAFTGSLMWEIVEPLEGPNLYEDFLNSHGEGVHHVAFACGDLPWAERVRSFEARGFALIQSGVWMGRVPYAYFNTEDATSTTFEIFDIPADFTLPEPEAWYPAPPPAA